MQLSNYEIEVERLKTTVIALNAKTMVVDDHIIDVQTTTERFTTSEIKREELQQHIIRTSEVVENDNEKHRNYQEELAETIN
jgi:uncharacterized membrane protein